MSTVTSSTSFTRSTIEQIVYVIIYPHRHLSNMTFLQINLFKVLPPIKLPWPLYHHVSTNLRNFIFELIYWKICSFQFVLFSGTLQDYPRNRTTSRETDTPDARTPGLTSLGGDTGPQTQFFEELLCKLDSERGVHSEVYCDEKPVSESAGSCNSSLLYGVHAASRMSDVLRENIFIQFINSQVKLSLEEEPTNQQTQG